MERLLQPRQGDEGYDEAEYADREGAGLDPEILAGKLEEHGDLDGHSANEIRDSGGHRGPQVGAELLRGHGDEDGPVADAEAEQAADGVRESPFSP